VSRAWLYGALVITAPEFALSTLNWTLATATLSVALAVIVVVPEIVAFAEGEVIATMGATVSAAVVNVLSLLTCETLLASVECTR
jgi:hypothetical protein